MRVSDFHFDLPEELIAQHPPAERGSSRMLVVERQGTGDREQGTGKKETRTGIREQGIGDRRAWGGLRDAQFRDLPAYLRAGDLLILNDSRVLPARLFATRGGLTTQAGSPAPSGVIEVLLTEEVEKEQELGNRERGVEGAERGKIWRALVRPARKVVVGERLEFREARIPPKGSADGAPDLVAEVVGVGEFGERTLRFEAASDFSGVVGRIGHMPLPPYIRRDQAEEPDSEEDRERYQTVYAQKVGSAAAPTAGLHFTPEVLAELEARGVEVRYVTLHVGLGTFQPVRVTELKEIKLHSERYTLPAATAEALNRARVEGRRVVAVGTTTTRTLEHIGLGVGPDGEFEAHSGATSIFIGPGHRFQVVGGLLTNFHLPESTLLMLVSAFAGDGGDADAGRRMVLEAYRHAVREGYRFYSYGDCMLVV